jgi:hypothetical protein
VTRLTWSLPLREPSPVDSPKLRHLLADRTGGITLGISKAFERAAIAATGENRTAQLRRSRDLAWRCHPKPDNPSSHLRPCGSSSGVTLAPLPLAPHPYPGEAVSSWVRGLARDTTLQRMLSSSKCLIDQAVRSAPRVRSTTMAFVLAPEPVTLAALSTRAAYGVFANSAAFFCVASRAARNATTGSPMEAKPP